MSFIRFLETETSLLINQFRFASSKQVTCNAHDLGAQLVLFFCEVIALRQKVSCNTTVNRNLLHEAKSLNIRLSEVFEEALYKAVASKQKERWLEQNSDAFSKHNESINKQGTFSERIGQLEE